MGKVTDELIARIRRQVQEYGLVVWFDPDAAYAGVLELLRRDGFRVETYDGSFFELRHRIDAALAGGQASQVVLYVPLSDADASGPLAEAVAAGVVMKPGDQAATRNTRLPVVARAALAELLPPATLESIIRQAESGKLTLADLDRIAETGGPVGIGALGLVFSTPNPAEIALLFLSNNRFDQDLTAKAALDEMASFLTAEYGMEVKDKSSPTRLREACGRQLLITELVGSLGEQAPKKLRALVHWDRPQAVEKAVELVRNWRNRSDLQASYIEMAGLVERELQFEPVELPLEALQRAQTFQLVEETLQASLEEALLRNPAADLVSIAEVRPKGFWAGAVPEIMERWALVAAIGRLLVAADRVQSEVSAAKPAATQLIKRYVEGQGGSEPWCALDALHRHMEKRFHTFEFHPAAGHELIEKLVAKARARYTTVATALADSFLKALQSARFRPDKVRLQLDTYTRFVVPALERGKTAYLLVDALRYEMARELSSGFGRDHGAELVWMLGTLPSITDVGMAALLPGANDAPELVVIGEGKVGLQVRGNTLRNRADRVAYLAESSGMPTCEMHLEDLLPPSRKVREQVEQAQLVVVTATDELDGLCERNNAPMARRLMDDILLQLRRGIRVLFEMGVKTAIVTSDHGFLFGETLDSASLIDAPGGQTMDLHRRVWVGKGGAASESYLRVKAKELGLGGDLELALPRSLGGFRAGGGSTYFHGGASPQELVVPVLIVGRPQPFTQPLGKIELKLTLGSRVISTRFLSVLIEGEVRGSLVAPPTIRVEVREGDEPLSRPVSSSYGFEDATGFVKLELESTERRRIKPNTITLKLEGLPAGKQVELYLLDAAREDQILATLTGVPVSVAF